MIYLFAQNPAEVRSLDATATQTDEGSLSATTDADGQYVFNEIPTGVYRVEPNMTGYSFEPSAVSIGTGYSAPAIVANPVPLHDEGCTRAEFGGTVVATDAKSRAQREFALSKADTYISMAKRKLRGKAQSALIKALMRSQAQIRRAFTTVLYESQALPKLVLDCGSKPNCRKISYAAEVATYQAQVDELRRLSMYVLRRARVDIDTLGGRKLALSARVIQLHKRARVAAERLPRGTYQCSDVGG